MRQPSPALDLLGGDVAQGSAGKKVLIVGPGFRFLSGLSVYTCSLANALADSHEVSVLLLDRLIPTRLYPGAARVGHDLTALRYDPRVTIAGTLDWYWGPGVARLADRIRAGSPDVIVLQWWTAATLHTYLLIAKVARRLGIPVIIEFHEVQDTGEAGIPMVASYCRLFLRKLVRMAAGAIFHNCHDRELIESTLGAELLENVPSRIAPHGPYDHLTKPAAPENPPGGDRQHDRPARILFFGLIRPYKGVEDLIAALDGLSDEQARQLEIDIVGETWENWTAPAKAIDASTHRDRIRFENRYVSDAEATEYFANADMLVLPYRRGSASGPLQAAMSNGISVILYAVGGLVEAVRDYAGAVLVAPNDIDGLRDALLDVAARPTQRFANPHTWSPLREAIDSLVPAGGR
jgi:glycosyltransferase involved in cell wall biosynthesis